MNLNDYQRSALTTAIYPDDQRVIYPALGITGEAGEVSDKVKKLIRDKGWKPGCTISEESRLELAKELGDVLWYVAVLSNDIDYTLDDVAKINIEKLSRRQREGRLGGSGDNR